MLKVFALLAAAAALAGCSTQSQMYNNYRHGTTTNVPISMPGVKINKVAVFQSLRYPDKVLVAPGRPSLMRVRTKYPETDDWLKAIPTFEQQFRAAAVEGLEKMGRKGCTTGKFVPLPSKAALEFEYQCAAS